MNDGGFLQNVKAGAKEGTDQVPAKMFELLIAIAAMDIGNDLKLDHPKNPKGDNPDVLITIGGVRWAIACKMMMGVSPISIFDRIKDGVEQIDRVAKPKGLVDRGVVVISLKNRLDYDEFWPILNAETYKKGEPPIFGAHLSALPVAQRSADIATEQMREMEKVSTTEKVLELLSDSAASPVVLLFIQTSLSILTARGPLPSIFPLLRQYRYKELSEHENMLSTPCMRHSIIEWSVLSRNSEVFRSHQLVAIDFVTPLRFGLH